MMAVPDIPIAVRAMVWQDLASTLPSDRLKMHSIDAGLPDPDLWIKI